MAMLYLAQQTKLFWQTWLAPNVRFHFVLLQPCVLTVESASCFVKNFENERTSFIWIISVVWRRKKVIVFHCIGHWFGLISFDYKFFRIIVEPDTKVLNAAIFTVNKEDHTLGNMIRW